MTRTTTTRRSLVAGLALATGLMAVPTAALAAPPVSSTDEGSYAWTMEFCGVPVLAEGTYTVDITEFVGDDGELDRAHIRVREDQTLTSEHGQVSRTIQHMDVYDAETGTFVHHGADVARGPSGRIEINAGRLVEGVSFAGIDTYADGDDSATCAILNP